MSDDIILRPMREADLPASDRVFRLAFGTWFGLADPMQFRGDAGLFEPRLWSYPDGGTLACRDDEIVGLAFASNWGSLGIVGPIAVLPELWRMGLARRLVAAAIETIEDWGAPLAGLFTFPQSALHLRLYQSFGFWPRHLSPVMSKPVAARAAMHDVIALSQARERDALAASCRALGQEIYPGLDLGREIAVVLACGIGEVLALVEGSRVAGFALCQCGPGSEGGSQQGYVKFAAVRPGRGAAERLRRLIHACEKFAGAKGVPKLSAGVSTGRIGAYKLLCEEGFRTDLQGVMMHRPWRPAYDGPDDWVLDDWR